MSSFPWSGCDEKRKNDLYSIGMCVLRDGLRFDEMKQYSNEVSIPWIMSYY